MEKPAKSKSKIFSFIFLNQPFSPGRDKFKAGKGFSGPIISIIPAEARRKTRNGSFDAQEPTSPKVSCIGQIKHKKKICKAKCATAAAVPAAVKESKGRKKGKQHSSAIGRMFRGGKGRKGAAEESKEEVDLEVRPPPPGLGQMRKFSSGREAFRDFDWRAAANRGGGAALSRQRGYYSDEEQRDDHSDEDDEDDFMVAHSGPLVAFSAPLAVGGAQSAEPRKEINIWKRRTMAAPRPLELNAGKKHF
ncbi:hypothetical protein H6P81_018716 [Aristolochia fimbriata]|uniref:Syringolide-induced protein 14-1-1 n=1 Tax=Aristolochia fimbriata TaxID=158543 RepID=A0AAV7E4Y2_ARIFI|nr:hypothetical protein H6P81_018716 [Aristolochia fimbriata]